MGKFLSQVKKGKLKKPHVVLITGVDGVGKSTFAAGAPEPIFFGPEDGTNNLDVARLPSPENWHDVLETLQELFTERHEFKTLVVDSLDWIEPILYKEICERYKSKTIDSAAGGYGKGYNEAITEWQKFISLLSDLRNKREMNIVMIAHVEVIKFNDPNLQQEYDRYQMKLYKKTASLFREFVDCVLFANFETITKKDGSKIKAFGDGVRIVYTERRPGFDAKNRYGLPFQMALEWTEFDKEVNKIDHGSPEAIVKTIQAMLTEVEDEQLKAKVLETVEKNLNNVQILEAIKTKLAIRLGE